MSVRVRGFRVSAVVCAVLAVGGCATADYAGGVNSFSEAISQANTTEQALAATKEKVELAEFMKESARQNVVVDFLKCKGVPGPYKSGDCVVEVHGKTPPTTDPSSMTALTKYAAALSAVVADKTCASLQSDATSIASSISGMATDAHHPETASAAGPLATIVSTGVCIFIAHKQLAILREATKDANPVIQELVPVIMDKDQRMYAVIIDTELKQLSDAAADYNRAQSKAVGGLSEVVSLADAADEAQALQPGALVKEIGTLHQALTTDLSAPNVTLKTVEGDAQAFIADAKTVRSAVEALSKATAAPAVAAASAESATKKKAVVAGEKKPVA